MLASSLDSNDSPLAQSSRCCVRKLSKNGGMQSLCSRYRSSFDRDFQSLHCFFYFRELRHFASCDMTKKTVAQCTTCSSFLAAKTRHSPSRPDGTVVTKIAEARLRSVRRE